MPFAFRCFSALPYVGSRPPDTSLLLLTSFDHQTRNRAEGTNCFRPRSQSLSSSRTTREKRSGTRSRLQIGFFIVVLGDPTPRLSWGTCEPPKEAEAARHMHGAVLKCGLSPCIWSWLEWLVSHRGVFGHNLKLRSDGCNGPMGLSGLCVQGKLRPKGGKKIDTWVCSHPRKFTSGTLKPQLAVSQFR